MTIDPRRQPARERELEQMALDMATDPVALEFTLKGMDHHQVTLLAGLFLGYVARARTIMGLSRASAVARSIEDAQHPGR